MSNQKGFGILEVLISATIIIVVIGATVGLVRNSLKNNILSSQRTQAYNLVREGLERARAARDTMWINQSTDDLETTFQNCSPDCDIDSNLDIIDLEDIELDGTIFIRVLDITGSNLSSEDNEITTNLENLVKDEVGDDIADELNTNVRNVTASVTWAEGDKKHSVSASTMITDWKPQY